MEEEADEKKEEEEESKAAEKFQIAGFSFSDRRGLWSRVQELTAKLESADEGVATGSDQFFLFALLELHPNAFEKMEGGVSRVGYGLNENFPDTKSFWVESADGSRRGFSARKCVEILFPNEGALFLKAAQKRNFSTVTNGGASNNEHYGPSPGKKPKPDYKRTVEPGTVVRLEGLEGQAISISDIKDSFGRSKVKWIDFDPDDGVATLHFDNATSATKALTVTDVSGCTPRLRLLDTAEEEELREKIKNEPQPSLRDHHHHSRGSNSGRGRGLSSYGPSSYGGGGGRLGRALDSSKALGGSRGRGMGRVGRPIARGARAGRSLRP